MSHSCKYTGYGIPLSNEMPHSCKYTSYGISHYPMGCPIHANILAMGYPTIQWDVPFMQIYWLWDIPLSNGMSHSCKYTSYGISHLCKYIGYGTSHFVMGHPTNTHILNMGCPIHAKYTDYVTSH